MNKLKILIALYAYYPYANANTNVIQPLIDSLSKHFDIDIVTLNRDNTARKFEIKDSLNIYRYKKQNRFIQILHILFYADSGKRRIWYQKLIFLLLKPLSVLLHKFSYFKHSEYKMLKRMIKNEKYAFVLSTCESFLSCQHVLMLKKELNIKFAWITYFMDPHAFYIKNLNCPGILKIEQEIYDKSDLILVTDDIFIENKSNILNKYINKTIPVQFGNLKFIQSRLIRPIFEKDKINCVYAGSLLDENIRSPKYLFKIVNELDDRFIVHMVCNNLSKASIMLCDSILGKNKIIKWYDSLTIEESMGIISNAEILINLGNKSVNQTPSKIFDYIGTGKPIINIYSLKNDTSKRYLENYPCKLNILEDENSLPENIFAFREFALNNAKKKIPKDVIKNLYSKYLCENVTKKTVNCIIQFEKNLLNRSVDKLN